MGKLIFETMDPVIDHINQALDRLEATSPVKYSSRTAEAPVCTPEDIITYWYSGTKEEQTIRHWKGLKETDDEIRAKFADTWAALSDLDNTALADEWAAGGPRSVLALIIVWDQFSRVLWRGDGRSFSNDNRAGQLAMKTVKSGAAEEMSKEELIFVKMPLLHSEDLEVHEWNSQQPGGESD